MHWPYVDTMSKSSIDWLTYALSSFDTVSNFETKLEFDTKSDSDVESKADVETIQEWKPQKKELLIMISLSFISLMVALDATILVTVLPVRFGWFTLAGQEKDMLIPCSGDCA